MTSTKTKAINLNLTKQLAARDHQVLWHPCTQMKDHQDFPVIPIKRASGVWLEDYQGNQYLDAVSSWWVNLFGHCNPDINAAIIKQLDQLEHVLLAGFSHEPAIQLAEQLVKITPMNLTKCFYADNGSSAIEAALKMSFHYWKNKQQSQKKKFIHLSNAYHGETLAALAAGDVDLYKTTYDPLLIPQFIKVPSPDCFHRQPDDNWETHSTKMFASMEETLAKHAHEVCAVIIEPLVQCAGNMRMYHPKYLTLLREACDRHHVLLIADEIAVGFGRTGTLFACEQANITPDILCLSKGITGGYLPLSAILTTDTLYNAFYDDYQSLKAFLHSHSYTGNPLACSAALATLDIFRTQNIINNNQRLINTMAQATKHFSQHPHIAEVRQHGMILAIEMIKNKKTREPYPWQERRGLRVFKHALSQGVLLRPLGNVVYFMPPYVITEEQIHTLVETAWQGIQLATQD